MAWLILFAAGLLEIGWALGLKYTDGFTRPVPTLLTIASMIASMVLLAQACPAAGRVVRVTTRPVRFSARTPAR